MRITSTTGGLLFVAALAAGLTGCSGGGAVTPTVTATPTTAADTPTPTPTCGPSSGAEAAAQAIADLPLPSGLEDAQWDVANSDYSGYDACAPLSWSIVDLERATGSSPVAILLFHQGRYLGTATKEAYAFVPDVARTDPATIAVTYHYAEPDESTADASGRTNATFTWNDTTDRVDMSGQTPPVG